MKNITGKKPKLILDTSVIIAGILSPSGGSGKILQDCQRGIVLCGISSTTYLEIERNMEKFPPDTLIRFTKLASEHFREIRPLQELVKTYSRFVDPDDAHLLAVSKTWKADFLVSLNRKHLLNNPKAQSAMSARVISPKDLIEFLGL